MTSEHVHLGEPELEREFRERLSSTLKGWKHAPTVSGLSPTARLRYRILFRQFRQRPIAALRWSVGAARWVLQKVRR